MTTRRFLLDPKRSLLVVRTRAAGLLARLAHDLEIGCKTLSGEGELTDTAWSGELKLDVAGVAVVGAIKGGRLEPGALSASDKAEIEKRMREQAFAGTREILVRASGSALDRGQVKVKLSRAEASASSVTVEVRPDGEGMRVRGGATLSAKSLGVPPIQAPLGAFKLADEIEAAYDLVFVPA